MKKFFTLPILFAFFAANSLAINELAAFFSRPLLASSPTNSRDSVPKIYKGYRLSLYNFRLEGESKKGATMRLSIVNTGRLPVIFSEKAPPPLELLVELDSAAVPPAFRGREELIVDAVLREKINLAPGKFRPDAVVKILFEKPKKPAEKPQKPPKIAEKPSKKPEKGQPEKSKKPAEPVVGGDANNGEKKPAESVVGGDANNGKKPSENPADLATRDNADAAKKAEKSPRDKTAPGDPAPPTLNPRNALPDLVIDTAWVVKRAKKSATVALVIRNQGDGTARLGGKSAKKAEDNLALNAYFSSSKKLSRGAMLADGIFIDDRSSGGLLLPMERFSIEIEVPLDAQTKFTSFVILELDPFQTIEESDKTNNTRAVFSEKK